MPMWDAENLFSNEEALTSGDSENIIDAGTNEIGRGQPIILNVVLSDGASGDLAVKVNTADTPDMAGATEVAAFAVPAERVARGGSVLSAALPSGCRRYLRLNYAGANGGTITAGLVQGAETSQM